MTNFLSIILAQLKDTLLIGAGGSCLDFETQYVLSSYLSENVTEPSIGARVLRSAFCEADCAPMRVLSTHTHGVSAANRSTASAIIDAVGLATGREVVFYQGSASDVKNGRKISRDYRWSKDTGVKPVRYDPKDDEIVAMVDVDYYVNMPEFLLNTYNPVILYTFQPSTVAKATGEYKYTFNANDEVVYHVSGGAKYQHKVWNYAGDTIVLEKKIFFNLITWKYMTYCLERRQMDDDHQLILLSPLTKHKGLSAWVAKKSLKGESLSRLSVQGTHGFTRLMTNGKDDMSIHTGRINEYACSKTLVTTDNEIASAKRTMKTRLNLPVVKQKMGANTSGCEILLEYHLLAFEHKSEVIACVEPYVRSYQWIDKTPYNPEAKPSLVHFMKPIANGAFAPDQSIGNDIKMVEERVEKVRGATKVTPFIIKVQREFVEMLKPPGFERLHPYGEDELREKQNRPTQRAILDGAEHLECTAEFDSMMKKEAGEKVGHPRAIAVMPGANKRSWAAFMQALTDHIKQFKWYAFSKDPKEVAQEVTRICEMAMNIAMTDFEKMDGRVDEPLRTLDVAVFMGLFHTQYYAEINENIKNHTYAQGKTRFGIWFESELAQLSGDASTSILNSLRNAFTNYLGWRMTIDPTTGKFHTSESAFAKLGIYGGDDGLTADVDPEKMIAAAKMCGQKLTIEVVVKGEVGVNFLSRQYGPNVWFGDTSSTCSISRTLTKFHTTVHMPENVTPEMKLLDKAYALYLTDADTPVIGEFVRRVMEFKPDNYVFKNIDRKWLVTEDESKQYPNEFGAWMMDSFNKDLPGFDHDKFMGWLYECNSLAELLNPPEFMPRIEPVCKPGIVVVDDDIIVTPAADKPEAPKDTQKLEMPTTVKYRPRSKKVDRPSRQSNDQVQVKTAPLIRVEGKKVAKRQDRKAFKETKAKYVREEKSSKT